MDIRVGAAKRAYWRYGFVHVVGCFATVLYGDVVK